MGQRGEPWHWDRLSPLERARWQWRRGALRRRVRLLMLARRRVPAWRRAYWHQGNWHFDGPECAAGR